MKEFLGGKSAGHTIFAKYFYKMYFTFRVVCDIVIRSGCSSGLEKGNVHNTLCATVMHCVVHAHIKLLCVLIYQ